jgi:hypothetical protein
VHFLFELVRSGQATFQHFFNFLLPLVDYARNLFFNQAFELITHTSLPHILVNTYNPESLHFSQIDFECLCEYLNPGSV